MSTVDAGPEPGSSSGRPQPELKLEVAIIPVADVDRAKDFYATALGWRVDADVAPSDDFRIVQLTPPGSGCSVQFGRGVTPAAPGSAQYPYLVVTDIDAAVADLTGRGVAVSEIFHERTLGGRFEQAGGPNRAAGKAPEGQSYGSFATFADPDGNVWLLQEITSRLPGRMDGGLTAYSSMPDLASALRRAAAAHGEHEARTGEADENWPDWYAEYMVREQSGEELPR